MDIQTITGIQRYARILSMVSAWYFCIVAIGRNLYIKG